MSELDVIRAVIAPIRASLSAKAPDGTARKGGPLYTNRGGPGGLDATDPPVPYYLLSPGPNPGGGGGPFDSSHRFFVEGWGTWEQMADSFERLGWLDGHQVGREGSAFNVRYGLLAEPARDKEPEATLADGRDMYHFSNSYQAIYVDLAKLALPSVAASLAQARAP